MGAYFDNNATTPLDPRVRDAMRACLEADHGNPSSAHGAGRQARRLLEEARLQVAGLLGGPASSVVFTSSGSEANNTVISATGRLSGHRGHIVVSALEHPSVRLAAERATEQGMELSEVPANADGVVEPAAVEAALRQDTQLVCLQLANNELGTLQPVKGVAALCRERGVATLCDAAQAVGKVPVKADELGVDFLTLAGHKFHAPLGIGVLWVRDGLTLDPLIVGGAQQDGRRAGTENVPAIVGLGKAAELAAAELAERRTKLLELRTTFERGLEKIDDAVIHAKKALRLPHTTHVAFLGLSGHELMLKLDEAGYAVSTGSACHSGRPQASPVLLGMGISREEALASLRVSFGLLNTVEEVTAFVETLAAAVMMMRLTVKV